MALPEGLPDWRDKEDKARDNRRDMRCWYRMLHEKLDQLSGVWSDYDDRWGGFTTEQEAAVIHGRIDDEVKAEGYSDDDLPAHCWSDESRQEYERKLPRTAQ